MQIGHILAELFTASQILVEQGMLISQCLWLSQFNSGQMLAKVNSEVCLTTEEYITEWKEGQYLVIAIVFTMAMEC